MPTSRANQAAQRREQLLDTAIGLFTERGYSATTMRDIATTADCSLGLTYRYFAAKEELVLALYDRLASQLQERAAQLPAGSIADRFDWFLRTKLDLIEPHRAAFVGVAGVAIQPDSDASVLGPRSAAIRQRVATVVRQVVAGADDPPPSQSQIDHLTLLLYIVHFGVLLAWLFDRRAGRPATQALLGLLHEALNLVSSLLAFPIVAPMLARLATTLGGFFDDGDGLAR